jgi:hypothetical protein
LANFDFRIVFMPKNVASRNELLTRAFTTIVGGLSVRRAAAALDARLDNRYDMTVWTLRTSLSAGVCAHIARLL